MVHTCFKAFYTCSGIIDWNDGSGIPKRISIKLKISLNPELIDLEHVQKQNDAKSVTLKIGHPNNRFTTLDYSPF